MAVVEKDSMIVSILMDEYNHSQEMLGVILKNIADCPKGALHIQKRTINGRVYTYPYLVFRKGQRVVKVYIKKDEWPELKEKLELRNKLIHESKPYQNRIRYIEKILGISSNKKSSKNIPS
jgi:hypothetical protein